MVTESTYTCQSGLNAKAVQAAGGWTWTRPRGWNPGGNFQSFLIGNASCPFQMKLSLSPTILTSTRLALTCRSSRSSRRTITCPAVPPRIRVSLWIPTAIFWIPSRGSSLKGSYVPTYAEDKAIRSRLNWSTDSLIDLLICWLTDSLISSITDWSIVWMTDWLPIH